jgi:D-methionine transport system permease protein
MNELFDPSLWSNLIIPGIWDSVYMIVISVVFSHIFGVPLGILLVITERGNIMEMKALNRVLGFITNLGRAFPFIILLVVIVPFTKFVAGTTIGPTGAAVPLTVAAIPFVGRMVEQSLREVPWGVVESALSMGASPWQIITKVLLPESFPSLVLGVTITTITLIGYHAMAGVVGGGGLGDIAVRYGYYRKEIVEMWISVILILLMVQISQTVGNSLAKKLDKR